MKKFFAALFLTVALINAQITFDANFESGNLNTVATTDSVNWEVTTIADIGGRWFYFRISGVKDKYIRVRIPSTDVNRPMYSYDNKTYQRFSQTESPQLNLFQKTFEEDTVYVAYYTPYTFSYLMERLNEWSESSFVKVDTLGYTDRNFPIHEVTLTDFNIPSSQKIHVWIHARTHPGETPSSWQFDGIVQKLLENDEVIAFYRQNIVFHLIPFTNPDGVYFGRSRTNFDGVDVEREWDKPDNQTCTEARILKQRMTEINSQNVLQVFLNLHSQAASYCTFWIHTAGSTSPFFYRREYQFSNLNTSDNPYFDISDYSESTLKSYFPEGWLWSNHGDQVMALTYETPYDHYSNNDWVTNDNLFEIGARTVYAAAEYLELSHPKHLIIDNSNALLTGSWQNFDTGLEFYGNDFSALAQGNGENFAQFESGNLVPGNYDLYAWWPANSANSFNTRFEINSSDSPVIIEKSQKVNGGQWNFLTDFQIDQEKNVSIKVKESSNGFVVADAFRIIYRGPVTSVRENTLPTDFTLMQNYPNPFNPSTTIRFRIKETSKVNLKVFDILGREIAVLLNDQLSAGEHEVIFDAGKYGLASGVYFYRLINGGQSSTLKMNFLK